MTDIPPVTHVLFDMDGLLLDTEIIYTRVTQKIVSRFGKTFDWSIKANMIGRRSSESARYLVDTLSLPMTPEEYLEERDQMLRVEFPNNEPLPGAEKLIRHLHGHGIPIALATSSDRDLFELKATRHWDWFNLFNVIVAGNDPEIENGKPAPDIFNSAANKLGAQAHATLVFEDAPSGLEAGIAAGMRVVAVPDPNMDRSRYADADLVLNSLEEFDPTRYSMPAIQS